MEGHVRGVVLWADAKCIRVSVDAEVAPEKLAIGAPPPLALTSLGWMCLACSGNAVALMLRDNVMICRCMHIARRSTEYSTSLQPG